MKATQEDISSIAERFVGLVEKYGDWNNVTGLSEDEQQILFNLVTVAGFEPKKVLQGKLTGNYLDQDGSSTGKKYPINSLCSFKVISHELEDDYFATGWLDCALRRVVFGASRKNETHEQLVLVMREEIERSIPLEPIPLNAHGDLLSEYPRSTQAFGLEYFVKHSRDTDSANTCVGVHKYCDGFVERNRATATHDALSCRKCHIRILFPKEVKTYGELRQALIPQHAPAAV